MHPAIIIAFAFLARTMEKEFEIRNQYFTLGPTQRLDGSVTQYVAGEIKLV